MAEFVTSEECDRTHSALDDARTERGKTIDKLTEKIDKIFVATIALLTSTILTLIGVIALFLKK